MSQTLTVVFDGNVFRPENPVNLEPDRKYVITIETETARVKKEKGIVDEIEGEAIYLDPNSAEGKALERIPNLDFDDASQWIEDANEGEIDVDKKHEG
ncbi:MAG: antitoxin AF2212-like protein [Cyanobacteriota bacterium]|nr:antitoxin AF2212-like protein [Cyanobacteriota bacterium]